MIGKVMCGVLLITMMFSIIVCDKKDSSVNPVANSGRYIDGVYLGETKVDGEAYQTSAAIRVKNGDISAVDWQIYDTYRERVFDGTYEEVYASHPAYIQQCRDNMAGYVTFVPQLIEKQDIDLVDNVTGATWCYNKFRQVVRIALKDAYPEEDNAK